MKYFLSIIIPVYNSSAMLKKCLQSVYQSSYKKFEVIVVDDKSTDGSLGIAKKFQCKILRFKKNSGPSKARNIGSSIAKGDILVFLDSDCIVSKDWLKKIVNDFKKYKVGAVAGQYNSYINESFISKFAFYELLFREKKFKRFVNTAPSCNLACKREVLDKVGGFSEEIKNFSEDLEFSYRLGKATKILWDPSIGVAHDFRKKIKSYLKQQFIYGKGGIEMLLKQPKLFLVNNFHDRTNYLEIISTALILIFIPLSILKLEISYILLLLILFILILNIKYLNFIKKEENIIYMLKSIFIVYIRNFIWIFGIFTGFLYIFRDKK